MMHYYLIEVEARDHSYVMVPVTGPDLEFAVKRAVVKADGLFGTPVACSKDAPEFGDRCKRELLEWSHAGELG